jgi:hypothetical protein
MESGRPKHLGRGIPHHSRFFAESILSAAEGLRMTVHTPYQEGTRCRKFHQEGGRNGIFDNCPVALPARPFSGPQASVGGVNVM